MHVNRHFGVVKWSDGNISIAQSGTRPVGPLYNYMYFVSYCDCNTTTAILMVTIKG